MREEQFPLIVKSEVRHAKDLKQALKTLLELRKEFETIPEKVFKVKDRLQREKNNTLNKRFKFDDVQYGPGDFVLYSVYGVHTRRSKLKLNWLGPAVVKEVLGINVYAIEDLLRKTMVVHARRLRRYNGQDLEFTEDVKPQYLLNRGRFYLNKVLEIKFFNGAYHCKCEWWGLEDFPPTWEKLEDLYKEAQDEIIKFLEKSSKPEMKKLKISLLSKNKSKLRGRSSVLVP